MQKKKCAGGFVYLLVIAAALAAAIFAITISSLNQGFRNQVQHVALRDLSFELAYSVMSDVMARVYAKPWAERFFASAPHLANNKSLYGHKYDLMVENSPGQNMQFDVYVRTRILDTNRMYFWRVHYNDNLLDVSDAFTSIYYAGDEKADLSPANTGEIAKKVEKILQNRAKNLEKAVQLTSVLSGVNNTRDIASILGAPDPDFSAVPPGNFNPQSPRAPELPQSPGIVPPMTEIPQDPAPTSQNPYQNTEFDGVGKDFTFPESPETVASHQGKIETCKICGGNVNLGQHGPEYCGTASPDDDSGITVNNLGQHAPESSGKASPDDDSGVTGPGVGTTQQDPYDVMGSDPEPDPDPTPPPDPAPPELCSICGGDLSIGQHGTQYCTPAEIPAPEEPGIDQPAENSPALCSICGQDVTVGKHGPQYCTPAATPAPEEPIGYPPPPSLCSICGGDLSIGQHGIKYCTPAAPTDPGVSGDPGEGSAY